MATSYMLNIAKCILARFLSTSVHVRLTGKLNSRIAKNRCTSDQTMNSVLLGPVLPLIHIIDLGVDLQSGALGLTMMPVNSELS